MLGVRLRETNIEKYNFDSEDPIFEEWDIVSMEPVVHSLPYAYEVEGATLGEYLNILSYRRNTGDQTGDPTRDFTVACAAFECYEKALISNPNGPLIHAVAAATNVFIYSQWIPKTPENTKILDHIIDRAKFFFSELLKHKPDDFNVNYQYIQFYLVVEPSRLTIEDETKIFKMFNHLFQQKTPLEFYSACDIYKKYLELFPTHQQELDLLDKIMAKLKS